jgi:hypothetical protein
MSDNTTQSDVVVDSSPQVEVVEPIEAEKVETESEQQEVETKEAEKEPDESSLPEGVKKRIDKVTRQKYEAIAESNRLKAEIEQLRAQIAPKQEAPDIAQFDDFESYSEAVAEYKYQQKQQEAQKQQHTQVHTQKVAQEWVSKVEEVRKVAPDFDQVFNNVASIEFAPMALEAIAGHKKGAEIAYSLGKDLSEAYRIAALPPAEQLMAIGELAAKTSLPKPKTVSSAPPPVKTVSGGNVTTDPSKMSTSDYIKWRNDQQRQKKR